MQPKLIKIATQNEYVRAVYPGHNSSGWSPVGNHIIVLPDKAAETSSGGISFTSELVERMTLAAETGVLVALGPDAYLWNADRTRKYEGVKPAPGDRVYMQRYSGQVMMGEDGEFYRVMSDNCVAAVQRKGDA